MEKLFEDFGNSLTIIDQCTVYTENIYNNGREFCTRYSGKDKRAVELKIGYVMSEIDSYRSPHKTGIYPYKDGYACDVIYYGLD